MKKFITVLMLVAVALVGLNLDTKAAPKKSSGSSFSLKSLINKVHANNNEPFSLSLSQTKALMKSLGFSYQSSYKTTVTDYYDETYEVDVLKFTKNGVSAEVYWGADLKFYFKFSNAANAKAFVDASKSAFGNALKKRDTQYLYLKNGYYWYMEQNGNTVIIEVYESLDGGESYY